MWSLHLLTYDCMLTVTTAKKKLAQQQVAAAGKGLGAASSSSSSSEENVKGSREGLGNNNKDGGVDSDSAVTKGMFDCLIG